jgi:hypothetical protein
MLENQAIRMRLLVPLMLLTISRGKFPGAKQFVSTGCARMANDHAVVVDLDCAQSELMLYVCFAVDKQGGHPVLQEVTIVPCHPACSL